MKRWNFGGIVCHVYVVFVRCVVCVANELFSRGYVKKSIERGKKEKIEVSLI